jgi:DNA repair exonuclease SbcCD ATPase subunit
MARELNRELFATPNATSATASAGREPAPVRAEDLRRLVLQVETLNKRLNEVESRVESVGNKANDLVQQNRQRFELVQGHFQRQQEIVQSGLSDVNTKIAQVASRVNERRVADNAIKEMVDRQAQMVQSYEVRLQQMQRVLSEQELQLMNSRAELKGALQELARLKKL